MTSPASETPTLDLKPGAPLFEGFVLEMVKTEQAGKAKTAVRRVLGSGWQVEAFGESGLDFEVTRRTKRKIKVATAWAWDKTYRLRAQPHVVSAEPMFTVPVSAPSEFTHSALEVVTRTRKKGVKEAASQTSRENPAELNVAERIAADFGGGSQHLEQSNDPLWSIKQVKVLEAWQRFPSNKEPGDDAVVGHPDTGYSDHPEIVTRLIKNKGYDFVKDDQDARDDLDSGVLFFPGHGTSTSSVIISPKDAQSDFGKTKDGATAVWGVAPGSKLIPLRVSRSVVLNVPWAGSGIRNLAKAIEHATNHGAHVISISLGTGFPHPRLRKAIQHAHRHGVIVLAAAGNHVPFVVWPAAYNEVIAVAAGNAQRKPWKLSSSGSAVDVTAPGESVWCAGVGAPNQFTVGRGSGTSYAVATVAGIAALWLSHHGRSTLIERYGVEKIPIIFNQIVRETCDREPNLPSGFGHGLVNADKVLAEPLPKAGESIPQIAFALTDHPAIDNGGLTTFHHLFEAAIESAARSQVIMLTSSDDNLLSKLAELLQVKEEEVRSRLKGIGQELAFNLVTDAELFEQFSAALTEGKAADKTVTEALAAGPVPAADLATIRLRLALKSTSPALKKAIGPAV